MTHAAIDIHTHILPPSWDDWAQRFGVSNRIAAYMLGVDRVAETTRMRGIYA